MCGIAVFRCQGLELSEKLIADSAGDLDYVVTRKGAVTRVEVRGFCQSCLCRPEEAGVRKLESLLEYLWNHSESITYSPNDYSDRTEECRLLKVDHSRLLREHWPSLGLPTQIEVTE